MLQTEDDIRALVQNDPWMMKVLRAAQELDLPEWWIGAGFLRNRVWNAIAGSSEAIIGDVDLVYFNKADIASETDWAYDDLMTKRYPGVEWQVRNQARMHYINNFPPHTSVIDGIAHWIETATCVAVRIEGDELKFLYCYGSEDLLGLVARPTPYFGGDKIQLFRDRIATKQWREKWPHLKVVETPTRKLAVKA